MQHDIHHLKTVLETEKKTVETELATVGRKNPTQSGEWEAVEPEVGRDRADETEVADGIEEYENNTVILNQLEIRLSEITSALEKMDAGTYGICEVCGAPIENDRLEANPAARTCKAHMNQ